MNIVTINDGNNCIIHYSPSDRISMAYVAGSVMYTSSALPNTVFISPSNFSSSPPGYQLAMGCYNNISTGSNITIRSIIANQTSQQFLPGVWL